MITKQRDHEERLADLEKASWQRKALIGSGSATGPRPVNLAKIIHAQVQLREGRKDAWEMVGGQYERDIVESATRKAIDTGTGGAGGGFVIPQEYLGSEFIEVLRAKSVVMRAGAKLLDNLQGTPVVVPKQLGSGTVYWLGQNSALTASDPAFGQVQMTPKTMGMRNQYSRLVDMLANPKIEELVRRDMAATAALELDRVALRGSGSSNQPLGINGVSGIGTYAIGTNGGPLTLDDLYGLIGTLEDANAMGDNLALVTHPKALRKLKKQRIAQYSGDTGGTYVVQPLLTDEALSKAIGLTCLTTTQLPVNLTKGSSTDCTEVYVGNWSELLIGQWGGVEILATNIGGNAWTQNAVEVRLILNVDIQVRHAASFVLCADARTA